MRILAVTNMYPGPQAPALGTFVEQQVVGVPKQLRAQIDRCQPDVVHVMYGGIMADQVTRTVRDRPTVVTFHGSDLLGQHLSGLLRSVTAGYGVRASWKAARRADRIVTVSKALKESLPRDINSRKVAIIPNGIDLERFKPLDRSECCRRLGWDPNLFHVLFPANGGDPVKRPTLAQAAVNSLQSAGIPAEMHYLRGIPNSEVSIWLNASDVVLLTSRAHQ